MTEEILTDDELDELMSKDLNEVADPETRFALGYKDAQADYDEDRGIRGDVGDPCYDLGYFEGRVAAERGFSNLEGSLSFWRDQLAQM